MLVRVCVCERSEETMINDDEIFFNEIYSILNKRTSEERKEKDETIPTSQQLFEITCENEKKKTFSQVTSITLSFVMSSFVVS